MNMKNKTTRPITDLRNTNEISNQCHDINEPIYITKNGYDDLVIMSNETFNNLSNNKKGNDIPSQSEAYSMIKVGCATNDIKVACVSENAKEIIKIINDCKSKDLDILVFPELSLTGYTCGDLFFFSNLNKNVESIYENTKEMLKQDGLMLYGKPATKDDIDNILKAMKVGMMMALQKDND